MKYYILHIFFIFNICYINFNLRSECTGKIINCNDNIDCQQLTTIKCDSSDTNSVINRCSQISPTINCDADGTCNSQKNPDIVCDTTSNTCYYDNKSCDVSKGLCIEDNLLFCNIENGVCENNACQVDEDCAGGAYCNQGICESCLCDTVNGLIEQGNLSLATSILCGNPEVNNCKDCTIEDDKKLTCNCPIDLNNTSYNTTTIDVSTCPNRRICNIAGKLECC